MTEESLAQALDPSWPCIASYKDLSWQRAILSCFCFCLFFVFGLGVIVLLCQSLCYQICVSFLGAGLRFNQSDWLPPKQRCPYSTNGDILSRRSTLCTHN